MASHTPAELRRAARALGEAARAQGLEPTSIGVSAAAPGAVEEVEELPEEPHRTKIGEHALTTGRPAPALFDIEREDSLTRAA
jgi:hypothetical protein